MAHNLQLREEMLTIERINNVSGLLAMTAVKEKMKPKALTHLFAKICHTHSTLNKSPMELKSND